MPRCILHTVCGLLLLQCPWCCAADDLAADFTRSTPTAWERLRKVMLAAQGQIIEVQNPGGDPAVDYWRAKHAFNGQGPWFKYVRTVNDGVGAGSESVGCVNSRYAFTLRQPDATASREVAFVGADKQRVIGASCRALFVGAMLFVHNANDIVLSSYCRINKASRLPGGDVEVSFAMNGFKERGIEILGGTLVVAPSLSWVVRRYELDVAFSDGPSKIVGQTEFQGDLDGVPLPLRSVLETRSVSGDVVFAHQELDYIDMRRGEIAESECTLSAFGLPEPEERNKERHRWLFFILAGVACLLAASYLRKLATRPGTNR